MPRSCTYTGSGTEATYYALRIARAYTRRNKVLKFEGAWHGMHDYGLWGTVPSRASDYPRALPDSVGVPDETGTTVLVSPFNETDAAVAMIERHAGDLAAVIVEPLQRVLRPEPGFLEALREATRRHGIVLIFDEIVTGFRIAWGGAQQAYGVVPDLACYGKAISGGFPLAAIAGSRDVMSVLDARARPRAEVVWATNTLNGNPVCAAAGLAALDVLGGAGIYDHLARIGARLREGLVAAGTRHGFAVQAPGEDAVFGLRFTARRPLRTWMDLTTADKDLGWRFAMALLARGLLVNPNEKFYLSITHTDADVDHTLEVADDAFAALARGCALSRVVEAPDDAGSARAATVARAGTGQRHEAHRQHDGARQRAIGVLANQQQVLSERARVDRDDHAPARLQLRDQRLGNVRRCGGDDDRVERRALRPAGVAVADAHHDVAVAVRGEPPLGLATERLDDLDRADRPDELGEHGGLVPGARADLEDHVAGLRLDQVGGQRHDVRLRDRLPLPDRQRTVLVGPVHERGRDEPMARHPAQRRHHRRRQRLTSGLARGIARHPGDGLDHAAARLRVGTLVALRGRGRGQGKQDRGGQPPSPAPHATRPASS